MPRKKIYDPYAGLIDKFNLRGVKYVVVGMSGINYYASSAQETFSTQDFDIFVKPTIPNVKKAVAIFKELGYSVSVKGQEGWEEHIEDATRQKSTIVATDAYGIMFELILAVSGYTFDQMERDAVIFSAAGVAIKVARLSKLLISKKLAARNKDRLFLSRFKIVLEEKKGGSAMAEGRRRICGQV